MAEGRQERAAAFLDRADTSDPEAALSLQGSLTGASGQGAGHDTAGLKAPHGLQGPQVGKNPRSL